LWLNISNGNSFGLALYYNINILCISVVSIRATKQETELRVAHASELVAEGQAYSSITSLVAAKYGISRRRARQITSNAYLLLKDDIEEGDLNRPEMTAKLICTLETAMHRAMQEKQYSAVASNAKVLMKLIGLEAKIKN